FIFFFFFFFFFFQAEDGIRYFHVTGVQTCALPIFYVLFAAVGITFFMGEYTDGIIILIVILINAFLGLFQEVRANNAIEALRNLSHPKAVVKRDGKVVEIDSELLVPGDIVLLEAGRYIPADLRLIETANLQIDESA